MSRQRYKVCIEFVVIAVILLSAISSFAETIRYSYDDMLRLIRTEYDNGTVEGYVYDNLGNRLMKTTTQVAANISVTLNAPTGGEIWAGTHNILWTATTNQQIGTSTLFATLYYGPSATGSWTHIVHSRTCASGVQASYPENTALISDGVYWIRVMVSDGAGNSGETISSGSVTVDNTPPAAPIVSSSTHPNQNAWYNNNSPVFSWNPPADLSGIAGYSCLLDQAATTIPSTTNQGLTSTAIYSNKADGDWYFHIRAVDEAGNWGNTAHFAVHINTGSAWRYRWPITITNNNSILTQYQVGEIKLQWNNINSPNYIGSSVQGNPIFSSYAMRFTDSDNQTLLPFWRRSWNTSSKISSVWVKVPQLPANSSKTIYLWGGNNLVADASSYDKTMTKIMDSTLKSCQGLWHMDEGCGLYAYDASGSGNTGIIAGAAWLTSDGGQWGGINKQFATGSRLQFNGQNRLNTNLVLPTTNFSYGGWFYLTTTGNICGPADSSSGTHGTYIYANLSTQLDIIVRNNGSAYDFLTNNNLTNLLNNWHFIVVTISSGSGGKCYMDGAAIGSNAAATSISTGGLTYTIGNVSIGNNGLVGYADENFVYNRVLSLAEIQAQYYRHKYAANQPTWIIGGQNTPDIPSNISPVNGARGISFTPKLQSLAFSSFYGKTQQASQWQITATSGNYNSPVYSFITNTDLTSTIVPNGKLSETTTYYWHVRYQDNAGYWSSYSNETSFITTSNIGTWQYRWPIMITNNNSLLTQYQVGEIRLQWNNINSPNYIGSLTQPGSSIFSSTGADIRFTDSDGQTLIPFWRRSWNTSSKISSVWVNVPQLPANVSKTIYLWGGNLQASNISSYSAAMTKITDTTVNSCVGLWHSDEGAGTTLLDKSGNGNSGTISGSGLTWQSADGGQWGNIAGRIFSQGSQLYFGGSGYVSVGTTNLPLGTTPRTVAAWIKTTMTGLGQVVSYGSGSTGKAFTIGVYGSTIFVSAWGSPQYQVSASTVNNGNWHQIALAYNGTNALVYLDGVLLDTRAFGINTLSGTANIGARISPAEYFIGNIDEVAIYNRALSQAEIQAQYYRHKYAANQPTWIIGGQNAPNTPSNISPANGTTSVTPKLQSSAFSSLHNATQQASEWQITATSGNYNSPVYSPITNTDLTSITVPSGKLSSSSIYYWHVRHLDSNGNWSNYSPETSFITEMGGNGLAGWQHHWPIVITNNNSLLTQYQVGEIKLQWNNINSPNYIGSPIQAGSSLFSGTGADMRFTDSDGQTLIPFWRRSWNTNSKISSVWIRVPQLPANSGKVIYLWGGNLQASDISSYSQTMTKIRDTTINSCAGLWHMDEGSGSTATDSSGNGNNGTLTNSPVWSSKDGGQWDSKAGQIFSGGSHLYFSGNKYVSVGTTNLPLGTTPRTVTVWIKTTMTGLGQIVSYGSGSTGKAFTIGVYGSTIFVSAWGSPQYQVSASTASNGQWHQIALAYNGTNALVYLDGVLLDTRAFGINTLSGTANIGARISPAEYFIGNIDEVAIYNRALSQAEIQAQYYRRKYAGSQPAWTVGAME